MTPNSTAASANPWTLYRWDARELSALLDRRGRRPLLSTTITSPPYGGLKDYGHPDQIGFGQAYEHYLAEMRSVFHQLHEHTRADGSLWLIADTYVAPRGKPPRLTPVPFDLSRLAEEAGWTLRDVIIWRKDRTLPWSNGTRLRNTFEYVLFLARGPKTKYRLDRLREHGDHREWWIRFPERYHPDGKAPTNVWDIPIPRQGNWGPGEIAHTCPLPPELVRRLVLLSTDPGDVVFDPFAGSGVVLAQAHSLDRHALGCELVGEHIEAYERIVKPAVERLNGCTAHSGPGRRESTPRQTIFDLRTLKLVRVLMQQVAKRRLEIAWPAAALVLRGSRRASRPRPHIVFILDAGADLRHRYRDCARELAGIAPASKFGLEPSIEVAHSRRLRNLVRGHRIYLYRFGKTARASAPVRHSELAETIGATAADSIPPIFSNIHLDIPPHSDSSVLLSSS